VRFFPSLCGIETSEARSWGGAERSSATGEGFFPRRQTPHPADCVRHLLAQGEKEESAPRFSKRKHHTDIKIRVSNGAQLADGDIITLIKGLKPKGSSTNPSSNRCYKRGMEQLAIKLLGFAAAACTTLAYAPQFVKVWKTRSTEDISLGMFLVMVLGLLLWLLYGLLSGDAPLIVANAITLVLAGGILWMKLKYG
jgi:MtN3 and saliva related transmembrane protein